MFKSLGSRIVFSVIFLVVLTVASVSIFTKVKTEEVFLESVEENALRQGLDGFDLHRCARGILESPRKNNERP